MRGGYRGGFRGGRGGGYGGGPGFGPGPFPMRPPPFDVYCTSDIFERVNDKEDVQLSQLTQDVIARSNTLTPSDTEKQTVSVLVTKVKAALDKVVTTPDLVPGVTLEEVREVGSFKKDTMLTGSTVADITVVMSSLPSFESVAALGKKLSEELRTQNEVVSCVSRDFGLVLGGSKAQVRILVTTLPSNSSQIEPDLHLAIPIMINNYNASRHAMWFEEAAAQTPLKILVRVLKDVRRRIAGLQPLSIWALEYLAFFCIMNTNSRNPLPVGPAFRRFFESLSAGIFLPGSPGLYDPADPAHKIAFNLTPEEMDDVCRTAQTIVRILSNGGQAAILGTDPTAAGKISDLSKQSTWNNVPIAMTERAYTPDCLKPKFCDEDEALAEKIGA